MTLRVSLILCKPPAAGNLLGEFSREYWERNCTPHCPAVSIRNRDFKPFLNKPTGQNQTFKYGKLTGSMFYELPVSCLVSPKSKKQKQKEIAIPHRQATEVKSISINVFTSRPFRYPRKTYLTFRQSIISEMSYLEGFSCSSQMDLYNLF